MKCPQCGCQSFDDLEPCRQCGQDLLPVPQEAGRTIPAILARSPDQDGAATPPPSLETTLAAPTNGTLPPGGFFAAVASPREEMDLDLEAWLEADDPPLRPSHPPPPAALALVLTDATALESTSDRLEKAPDNSSETSRLTAAAPVAEGAEDQGAPALAARLLAGVFDLALLLGAFMLFVTAGEALRQGHWSPIWPDPALLLNQAEAYGLVFALLAFGYFTLFHYLVGQTPGKMASRLQVESLDGAPLGWAQAVWRSLGDLLCLLPGGLGFLSIIVRDGEGRGWNDRLAGSRVAVVAADEEQPEA
jgi:uncharacterized RDD family membrane protein YckC